MNFIYEVGRARIDLLSGDFVKDLNNPDKEVQIKVCKRNGLAIMFIKNPCLEVQMEAVKQVRVAINYIDNPCEEVKSYVYGEITDIELNSEVCKKCGKKYCKFFEGEYVRSGCLYLIEHKAIS